MSWTFEYGNQDITKIRFYKSIYCIQFYMQHFNYYPIPITSPLHGVQPSLLSTIIGLQFLTTSLQWSGPLSLTLVVAPYIHGSNSNSHSVCLINFGRDLKGFYVFSKRVKITYGQVQWYSLQEYGFLYSWPFLKGGPSGISHLHWSAKNLLLAYPPRYCLYSYLLTTHGVIPPNVPPRLHKVIQTKIFDRDPCTENAWIPGL